MSGGAHYRNAVFEPGKRVAGAGTAADEGRPCAEHSRLRGMGAPGTKLDDLTAARCVGDSCRFSGDQGFEGQSGKQVSFRDLALDQRRADVHHGLARIKHGAFGDGENVSGEAEGGEIIPEAHGSVPEVFEPLKIRDFVGFETEVQQVIDRAMKTGGHYKVAIPRQMADRELERTNVVLFARGEVSCRHGQLIEICKKAVQAVTSFSGELVA